MAGGIPSQQLVKNQSTTIGTDYVIGDVAITDQGVCDYFVKEGRREIYLNARKPGSVALTIWDAQGAKRDVVPVHITATDMGELASLISGESGASKLRLTQSGGDVVVEGEVNSADEFSRIQSVAAGRPGVKTAIKLGSRALDDLSGQVERAIGRPGISVRRVKDRVILEGVAYSADAYAHAEKIARIFDPGVLNLIEVRDTKRSPGNRPLVVLDLYFMEVKKSALRRFGISWTPGAGAGVGGRGGNAGAGGGALGGLGDLVGAAVGFVTNLIPKLHLAREKGLARVLEHPSLVVKSGESAEFFSGTEVPYFSAQNVQFKDVGIKIQAEPIAYGDNIDLKITARLSSLSAGVRQGVDTRTISTSAYCKNGDSVVLGGLFNNGDAKTLNRVPDGVDTASAIFTLALSKDFQSHQSDFVLFVTPRIAERAPPADQQLAEWIALNEEITKKRSKKEWKNKCGLRIAECGIKNQHSALATPQSIISMPDSLKSPAVEAHK